MGKGGALGGDMADQQTAVERRVLRQEYRKLFSDVLDGKEQLEDAGSGALQAMLDKVELLRNKVEKPREHAVDADVLCHLTERGLSMVSRGHAANQGRTPAAFIAMLRHAYAGDAASRADAAESMAWHRLGEAAAPFLAPAPGVGCMLGPLEVRPKPRANAAAAGQRRRRGAEAVGEVVRAQELAPDEMGGEQEKQETDRNMLVMWDCLQRAGGAASFAALVLNPASFGQTVENIFTLSFLIRDRRVSLRMDPESGLMVRAAPKAAAPAGGGGAAAAAGPAVQVMSFGFPEWEVMRGAAALEECLMPHRAAGNHGGGGGKAQRGAQRRREEEESGSGGDDSPAPAPKRRARRSSR
ncbi:MAG: Nse4 C-terminal-domain-containing protein [Monoraphidium minutum]|nr:MAG: Nse4 C-terminal-domain-containing protein [Monoraphidium minutum]